ncbi:MAG: ComEC/Rec2 family competence protein [Acidimicrobiia bacterium]
MTVVARMAVCGAAAAWAGVGRWWALPLVLFAAALFRPLQRREYAIFAVIFVAGSVLGWIDRRPPEPLPAGAVTIEGRVDVDLGDRWGWSGLVSTDVGTVLVRAPLAPEVSRVRVEGVSDGRPELVLGRWTVATVDADELPPAESAALHERVAGRLEARILTEIRPESSTERGLLVGFLIGDTSGVSPVVIDEMRRAGLSHLVAVSGSNVALFLIGVVVVTAPLAMRPLGRLLVVLNGLLVFGALTRWEPSVLRAAAMAGLVGVGRFAGFPLEPITALAVVGGGSVLVAPGLVDSVGFQLSVLATAGLLAGARLQPDRGPVFSLFTATLAAQAAVAPVLLATFGSVPLLSPIANLVAIPLVTVATSLAGIGAAVGADWVIGVAELLAQGFVAVARVAAPWPQLDAVGFAVVLGAGLLWWRFRPLRAPSLVIAAVVLAIGIVPADQGPHTGLVVLDVGQGDAVVVRLAGFTVLVDGGPDPAKLATGLARYGVDRIDLAVATHVHEDHVAGLAGIMERVPISRLWAAFEPHATPASRHLIEQAHEHGVPLERPELGDRIEIAGHTIDVVGPRRRYAGPNDQSIVLVVQIGGTRILLTGDIETVAQSELQVTDIDVLKVPHQGAGTSDPAWLAAHSGDLAIVSVGPNSFGHPTDWVLETLGDAGATVLRTDRFGDVIVEFEAGKPPSVRTAVRPRERVTRGGRRSGLRRREWSSPRHPSMSRFERAPRGRGWWRRFRLRPLRFPGG